MNKSAILRKFVIVAAFLSLGCTVTAGDKYQATWESLRTHPNPHQSILSGNLGAGDCTAACVGDGAPNFARLASFKR